MRLGTVSGPVLLFLLLGHDVADPAHVGEAGRGKGERRAVAHARSAAPRHGGAVPSAPLAGEPPAAEVAMDSLQDVALAVYRPEGSTIYYNPVLMQRVGPLLAAFFLEHERGHLALHHTRANALLAGWASHDSVLQSRELAADCYAAERLVARDPLAVEAAVRFFRQLGPLRFDAAHPSGAERMARILSCTPRADSAAGEPAADTDPPPDSVGVGTVDFTVTATPRSEGAVWYEARFRIGDRVDGMVTNLRLPMSTAIRTLTPGIYQYDLEVDVYILDDLLQLNPAGAVEGRGTITIRGGESFRIRWAPGGPAILVPDGPRSD